MECIRNPPEISGIKMSFQGYKCHRFKAALKLAQSISPPTNNGRSAAFNFHHMIALQIVVGVSAACGPMVTLASCGDSHVFSPLDFYFLALFLILPLTAGFFWTIFKAVTF